MTNAMTAATAMFARTARSARPATTAVTAAAATSTTLERSFAVAPTATGGTATTPSTRRSLAAATAGAAALLLSGCAAINTVSVDVSTFGEWPAGRQPGSYAYERLPSQQADPASADAVEAAAREALRRAGFTPAEGGRQPDVLVQVGAREARAAYSPWDDPLWWHGGFGYWRHGPWMSPRWGMGIGWGYPVSPRYERTAALLVRDRASGKPLFEARASSEGNYRSDGALLQAMFTAALMDFPHPGVNPRRVVVQIVD